MRKVILLFGWLVFISPYQVEAACDPNIPADLSGDCHVDFNDLAIMASDWLKPAVPHEWLARYDGPSNYEDYPRAIAVHTSDNIYVTGYSVGSGTSFDYATVKYSPDYSCTPQISGDFDDNCAVDIYDLAIFCRHWLECSLDPPQDCWQ